MRLLFLSSEFPPGPGGIGTQAYQLARHLTTLGWEIVVVTPQCFASDDEIEIFNKSQVFQIVRLFHVPGAPLKALYRWAVVARLIKRWEPNIILASGDREVYLGAQLARHYRLPWVAVEHGRNPSGWERRLKRWSFQRASAVVCVSRYTLQSMLALGTQPRAVRVIPNGADVARFVVSPGKDAADFRKELYLDAEHILLTVGSVTDRKGQDILIRALPRILEEAPNTHYVVAGLPLKQKEFTNLAYKLGVADRVHFLGQVDNSRLVSLYNCCDVFVMTSRHTAQGFEGFGIAVVEAALCGKPAVVSANCGLAEAILDGETGFGVPENDEIATAQAILSLLKDEEQRKKMGEVARKRAVEEQTWEPRIKEYDVLLRSVVQLTTDNSARSIVQEPEVV